MMKLQCAVILAILLLGNVAYGAITVETQPSKQKTSRSDFDEDHLDLVVKDNGKITTWSYFYSSYGIASANVELDTQGNVFILLRHGEGRGTSVRQEYITAFRYEKNSLDRIVTFPVSGFAGSGTQWEYRIKVYKPKAGGLQFKLTRRLTGDDVVVYPSQKERTIIIK
jgi:hypothetical protein